MTQFPYTIGFIGAGRMATALARGCLHSGLVDATRLIAADPSSEAKASFVEQVPGAQLVDSNQEVFNEANFIVLAVKPQMMDGVLKDIADHVQSCHVVVSIAAGVTLEKLAAGLSDDSRLVRVMPNTPCLVGLGVSCYCCGGAANSEDGQLVAQVLGSVGEAIEVGEEMLDAVTGLSGSGPAFVYRMIEALAEGGAAAGLSADLALRLAALTARGAAEMVLVTGRTPKELREQVTSPGGTTLAGLEELEQRQGPAAFSAAVQAATKRSKELAET